MRCEFENSQILLYCYTNTDKLNRRKTDSDILPAR
jgi:hypothetical protein